MRESLGESVSAVFLVGVDGEGFIDDALSSRFVAEREELEAVGFVFVFDELHCRLFVDAESVEDCPLRLSYFHVVSFEMFEIVDQYVSEYGHEHRCHED